MLAYGIWLSGTEAAGTVLDRSREAGAAGTATMTASASRYSGSAAEPTVSRQPAGVRSSARTIALVRMLAFEALGPPPGTLPTPRRVVSVTNTGAGPEPWSAEGAGAGGSRAATASVSDAWVFVAAASGASVAWKDSSSLRPRESAPGIRSPEDQLAAAAGITAAGQRVKEPVDDLLAQRRADVPGDRGVGG